MEKVRSFLSIEDSSETCLLCGDLLKTKGKLLFSRIVVN